VVRTPAYHNRTLYTHHYPHIQCLPQPLGLAEAEEVEEVVEVVEELFHHPTQEAFKVFHPPFSAATAPEVTPSYANSSATKD